MTEFWIFFIFALWYSKSTVFSWKNLAHISSQGNEHPHQLLIAKTRQFIAGVCTKNADFHIKYQKLSSSSWFKRFSMVITLNRLVAVINRTATTSNPWKLSCILFKHQKYGLYCNAYRYFLVMVTHKPGTTVDSVAIFMIVTCPICETLIE